MLNSRRSVLLAGLGFCSHAFPGEALACRAFVRPEDRVRGRYDAIAIGDVIARTQLENLSPGDNNWEALTRVRDVIEGEVPAGVYKLSRFAGPAACNDGQPIPAIGERWALYFVRDEAQLFVRTSYPLEFASRFDPRLANATRKR